MLGTLVDTGVENDKYEIGFFTFIHLIETVYKKHETDFMTSSPEPHYRTFIDNQNIKEQHFN